MIYLDNSATTRPFDAVIALMADIQQQNFGNPSSLHRAGILAERAMKTAREQVLTALGANDGTFVFTAGGTEANNLAILGTMLSRIRRTPQIITTKIEHPSVMEAVLYLESLGADCRLVDVKQNGQVDEDHFASLLTEDTALVSVMSVNNETGAVQDVETLCRMAKQKNPNVLFHTDAVQAFGKIPLNLSASGVDLVSISGHKINGPKGVGGLYIRRGVHVKPILHGGGQENGLRSGTQNVPAIAGFGLASEMTKNAFSQTTAKMHALREMLSEGLDKIPGCKVIRVENSAPHVVSFTCPGVKSETLLHTLEMRDIYVSSGSACSSNKPQLSPTLLAMGYNKKEIEGAIRLSLGHDTTEDDIRTAIAAVKEETALLIGISR